MCNDDIANLAPTKKFFNSVFTGETFSPIDMYDQVDGGVRWWRNEGVACQKMVQSSKTVKQTPVMMTAVNRPHQGRM